METQLLFINQQERMARKRTPTKEENGRSRRGKENASKASDKALAKTDRLNKQPSPSSTTQHVRLTLATILVTTTTAVICYCLYPHLDSLSVSPSTSNPVPSLRQVVDSKEHSSLSTQEANIEVINNAFQPDEHSEVRKILSNTGSLLEAEDEEIVKLAKRIMEIKASKTEGSEKVESADIDRPGPAVNSLPSEISDDLNRKDKDPENPIDSNGEERLSSVNKIANPNGGLNEKQRDDDEQSALDQIKIQNDSAKQAKKSSLPTDRIVADIPVLDGSNTRPIVLNAENPHITIGSHDKLENPEEERKHTNSENRNLKKTNKKEEEGPSKIKKSNAASIKSDKPTRNHVPGDSISKGQNKENAKKTTNANKNKNSSRQKASSKKVSVTQDAANPVTTEYKPSFLTTVIPKKTFYGGRRIAPVQLLNQKPSNSSVKVYLFDDFLSEQECQGLMRAHISHVKGNTKPPILCFNSIETLRKHIRDAGKKIKVSSQVFTEGTRCVNVSFSLQLQSWLHSNWSYSTAFYPGESKFSSNIDPRLHKAMGLKPENGGKFQITSYPIGKAYKTHTDCTLGRQDKRDRVISVLMYLNDAEEGGETKFPDLGISVTPKRGRAIVWNNMSPEGVCEPNSRHVGSLVKKGKKFILIRWYYYESFPYLGQRHSPPQLPHRDADQAKVSCDDYDNGSCRWYDEWTHEHLLT